MFINNGIVPLFMAKNGTDLLQIIFPNFPFINECQIKSHKGTKTDNVCIFMGNLYVH